MEIEILEILVVIEVEIEMEEVFVNRNTEKERYA